MKEIVLKQQPEVFVPDLPEDQVFMLILYLSLIALIRVLLQKKIN